MEIPHYPDKSLLYFHSFQNHRFIFPQMLESKHDSVLLAMRQAFWKGKNIWKKSPLEKSLNNLEIYREKQTMCWRGQGLHVRVDELVQMAQATTGHCPGRAFWWEERNNDGAAGHPGSVTLGWPPNILQPASSVKYWRPSPRILLFCVSTSKHHSFVLYGKLTDADCTQNTCVQIAPKQPCTFCHCCFF